MTTSSKVTCARAVCWMLSVAVLPIAVGCGADFDSPDQIKTLRVIAVQKDHPYAAPTEDPMNPSLVNMTMLWHDGVPRQNDTDSARPIQRLWFSGCDDLPGDQYFSCLARIHEVWEYCAGNHPVADLKDGESFSVVDCLQSSPDEFEKLLSSMPPQLPRDLAIDYLSTYRIGAGDRFTYPIPLGIIENHRSNSDSAVPPYGLSFVFFTACAGHIDVAPEWKNLKLDSRLTDATLGFPFLCLDDTGNALGPDDYVAGYTQQFVYGDGSANLNPVIDGLKFDGKPVAADALCVDGACVPEPRQNACDLPDVPRRPACKDRCPKYALSPQLDASKNDEEDIFASRDGSATREQMWIVYYADRGKIDKTARSLRDSNLGWFDDNGSAWTPPSDPGPVNVWAVVHDNRGGTSWVRLQVCVE
jgi:hypothetical protein